MLRAIIRSGHDALHFIGDLNGYNLQTLQLHARGALRESGSARIELELDAADAMSWKQHERGWLARMERAGVAVVVRTVLPALPAAQRREPIAAA